MLRCFIVILGFVTLMTGPSCLIAEVISGTTTAEQEGSGSTEPEEVAPEKTLGPLAKLQIHGYLSQAYATADFTEGGFFSPTQDEVVLGIPESGTTDYRTLALQFRYSISDRDSMVVQLSHRALGQSPIGFVEDDIELDWAFYRRSIGDKSYLKVGRVPIPLGIFNEIRDVGTLLPFYRAPFTFYREGSFTSETIDGVIFGHTFGETGWTSLLDIYAGGWDLVEFAPPGIGAFAGIPAAKARAEDAVGLHLWVNTPLPGLRFGGGIKDFSVRDGILEAPGTEADWSDWHLSFDAVFDKFVFRSEFRRFEPEVTSLFPTPVEVENDIFYAQVGFHPTDKWHIYTQYELSEDVTESTSLIESFERTLWRELAVAIGYAWSPNLMVKAEIHFIDLVETANVVGMFPNPPGPPLFRFGILPAEDGTQTLISLSASF